MKFIYDDKKIFALGYYWLIIFFYLYSSRVFGFVARKPASNTDNQCHIFAELEPEQPATAIVNFVSKVMMNSGHGKQNIVWCELLL